MYPGGVSCLSPQGVMEELSSLLVGQQTLKWEVTRTSFGACQFCTAAYARALSTHTSSMMAQLPTPPKHKPQVGNPHPKLAKRQACATPTPPGSSLCHTHSTPSHPPHVDPHPNPSPPEPCLSPALDPTDPT